MQQIIVYRNPLEAAIWNSLLSADGFIIMVSLAVFFFFKVISSHYLSYNIKSKFPYIELIIGTIAGIVTAYLMF